VRINPEGSKPPVLPVEADELDAAAVAGAAQDDDDNGSPPPEEGVPRTPEGLAPLPLPACLCVQTASSAAMAAADIDANAARPPADVESLATQRESATCRVCTRKGKGALSIVLTSALMRPARRADHSGLVASPKLCGLAAPPELCAPGGEEKGNEERAWTGSRHASACVISARTACSTNERGGRPSPGRPCTKAKKNAAQYMLPIMSAAQRSVTRRGRGSHGSNLVKNEM
jgi:hypothetical protein